MEIACQAISKAGRLKLTANQECSLIKTYGVGLHVSKSNRVQFAEIHLSS